MSLVQIAAEGIGTYGNIFGIGTGLMAFTIMLILSKDEITIEGLLTKIMATSIMMIPLTTQTIQKLATITAAITFIVIILRK